MSFDNATDVLAVKRLQSISVFNVLALDHFRLLVYRLNTDGSRTLTFTSNQFVMGTSDEVFTFYATAEQDVSLNRIGIEYGYHYQLELIEYDAGETTEAFVEESFVFADPNQIQTSSAAGSIDSDIYTKLLYMLGYNTSLLEFNNRGGYTSEVKRRGYVTQLTDETAGQILDNAADGLTPNDADTNYKTNTIITTAEDGNQLSTLEQESDLTP